jgi:small-conductance mechanosensitive channel
MNFLDQIYLNNTVQNWLTALIMVIVTFIILKVIQSLTLKKLTKIAQKTQTEIDDLLIGILSDTKLVSLLIASIYVGSYALTLKPSIAALSQKIIILTFIIQAAFWGTSGVGFWLNRTVNKRMNGDTSTATTISFLGVMAKIILWSIALLLILDNLGVNITSLVAGLGIGGIAVALAMQNILGDLLASLSIVLDKPFVIGDTIAVDGLTGTIEYIGMKTTRLRSIDGEELIFSNNDLLKCRIRNYKRMQERRIVFGFGVVYQTPSAKLTRINQIIQEIVEAQQNARFDRVHFKSYGDSSLNYEVVYFVTTPDYTTYMDIQQAINLEIFRRFENEKIDFAYPTRTLYIQK